MNPLVEAFFDPATYTWSYVVSDPATPLASGDRLLILSADAGG